MSTSKKARKLKPVKASESLLRRGKLRQITLEHKHISSILRESDKWLKIAEIRNPKIDRSALMEKMVNRKKDLALEINKFRKIIQSSPSIPDIDVKRRFLPSGWDFPDFEPDPDLRDLEFRAMVAEIRHLLGHLNFSKEYVLPGECAPQSGLITMADDLEYLDIMEPSFSTTNRHKSFTVLEEPEDYFGVSFADMYIDVSDAQIDIYDSFFVATVLKFEFPPAPCDGMLYFYLKGKIALSPEIDGDSGIIRVQTKYRFNIEGDGFDPTSLVSYWLIHSLGVAYPSFQGTIRRDIDLNFRNVGFQVSAGEKGVLRLAIPVLMGVGGGRSSFSQNGDDPVGYVIVMKPPGGTSPGVSYDFVPNE